VNAEVLGDQTIYWDGGELARKWANRKVGTGWGQKGTNPVVELGRANWEGPWCTKECMCIRANGKKGNIGGIREPHVESVVTKCLSPLFKCMQKWFPRFA
jgi:hypothetical protein